MNPIDILVATSNADKAAEIRGFFETTPHLSLHAPQDIAGLSIDLPQETADTLEGNALIKAKTYAHAANMIALADDTGLFVDALDGWPGIASARIAQTPDMRNELLLERLTGQTNRTAHFRTALALYDPFREECFVAYGDTKGTLLENSGSNQSKHMGYDALFYIETHKKTYGQMKRQEKNAISHRSEALEKVRYHIADRYLGKQIVVPIALILKDGKILLNKRNDPHNSEFHGKWEFPGGSLEMGEQPTENLLREVAEEAGYFVEIVELLQTVQSVERHDTHKRVHYQVTLLPFVCRILSGNGETRDDEVLETQWLDIEAVKEYDLIGANQQLYAALLPELKTVITKYSL